MTTWNISKYQSCGEVWVHNVNPDHTREFVARFKYANPGRSATHFAKFLAKHFTPEEYFAQLKQGVPPVKILEAKGFVSYNVSKYRGLK